MHRRARFVSCKLIGTTFHYHLPNIVSLSIVALILGTGILRSLKFPAPKEEEA